MDTYRPSLSVTPSADAGLRHFVNMVYGWMCTGLLVTGACAGYMTMDPQRVVNLRSNTPLFFGLMIAELALVFVLSGLVQRLTAATATFVFLFYAALTGVTASVILIHYTSGSIANVFFLTAGMFGALCLYGYTTKTDLTAVGGLALMCLIGIILASLLNLWLHSPMLDWITTYCGIVIFSGLTAYDAQKVKAIYQPGDDGTDAETKEAIFGALTLYLDFINLFLELLKVFGSRRD